MSSSVLMYPKPRRRSVVIISNVKLSLLVCLWRVYDVGGVVSNKYRHTLKPRNLIDFNWLMSVYRAEYSRRRVSNTTTLSSTLLQYLVLEHLFEETKTTRSIKKQLFHLHSQTLPTLHSFNTLGRRLRLLSLLCMYLCMYVYKYV